MRSVVPMKTAKIGYLVIAVLFCVLGIVLIAAPGTSVVWLGRLLGIGMIVFGAIKLVGYFSRDLFRLAFQYDLAFGILLIALGIVTLARKGNEKPRYTLPSYAPVTATPRLADTPQPGEATPEASAEVSMTPKPTAEPTPTPSGAKAQRDGDLIVPADWGAIVPERANAVYDSHFDRSCMIGNSLVDGFLMWSGVTNMRCIYGTGAVVNNVLGTLDLSPLQKNADDVLERASRAVGAELRALLGENVKSVLVAGLGNANMTPDAIGPRSAEHVLVTRHLRQNGAFSAFCSVSVLTPGVLGRTGIEAME